MQLNQMVQEIGAHTVAPDHTDTEILSVTHNSRWVEPGALYVAIPGNKFDGHQFIPNAVAAGAVAVAGEGLPEGTECPVPYLTVTDARKTLALASAAIWDHPSRKLTVIGITGTDGKTSTTLLTCALLRQGGIPTGMLSTVGYQLPDGVMHQFPQHFTTPEAPQVQEILQKMLDAGAKAVVLESSSHALALHRVGAVDFDYAVWTHLSREHLDFHHTLEEYFAAKRLLIENSRHAILNSADPWVSQLHDVADKETTYGVDVAADWQAIKVKETATGLQFNIYRDGITLPMTLPMLGKFNVENALAACTVAWQLGVTEKQMQTALASFAGVPGRMQFVQTASELMTSKRCAKTGKQPRVIVDFAHTPDSLDKALQALRATTVGKLWCLVGAAGGARDEGRIAPMGQHAAQNADYVVFTEDDSYDTDLNFLLGELQKGAAQVPDANVQVIPDREEALRYVLTQANTEDTVLLAGKGHESTLVKPSGEISWDETQIARKILAQR